MLLSRSYALQKGLYRTDNVLSDQTDKLAASLAKVSGKDIVAFAQALKVSDPTIDGKICKGTNSSADTKAGECRNGSGSSNGAGLSAVFTSGTDATADKWPNGGGANKSGKGSNVANVTSDIMTLSKDEKAVVAGHRDVFSGYNKIHRYEVLVQGVDNLLTISPHSYPRLWE